MLLDIFQSFVDFTYFLFLQMTNILDKIVATNILMSFFSYLQIRNDDISCSYTSWGLGKIIFVIIIITETIINLNQQWNAYDYGYQDTT